MKNPRLEKLKEDHRTAEIRLTREKHREKQQLAEAKQLTRKARTRRLCTRGGMLESFLQAPNILTDDDVMDLLTFIFRQPDVRKNLRLIIEDRKKTIETKLQEETEAEV